MKSKRIKNSTYYYEQFDTGADNYFTITIEVNDKGWTTIYGEYDKYDIVDYVTYYKKLSPTNRILIKKINEIVEMEREFFNYVETN